MMRNTSEKEDVQFMIDDARKRWQHIRKYGLFAVDKTPETRYRIFKRDGICLLRYDLAGAEGFSIWVGATKIGEEIWSVTEVETEFEKAVQQYKNAAEDDVRIPVSSIKRMAEGFVFSHRLVERRGDDMILHGASHSRESLINLLVTFANKLQSGASAQDVETEFYVASSRTDMQIGNVAMSAHLRGMLHRMFPAAYKVYTNNTLLRQDDKILLSDIAIVPLGRLSKIHGMGSRMYDELRRIMAENGFTMIVEDKK